MSIDSSGVEHIAELSRLSLSKEELELFGSQLSDILAHIKKLEELDTSGVEPTSHALALENVDREDVVRESLTVDEALSNAPDRHEGFYRVPKIIV
ncbi:MAG TPA: Asp-tRNA(Asn)/Glu-tRNA(Gln) amidotransferase subunit GatC [Nitrospirae bacterium]|nr:Asp-tRNA(Asn)/Glu-tRNA(Gln) amidotransferase subunit GatC [Nitrospirota bacterium]